MGTTPKTSPWSRIALGVALLFWIAGLFIHYFSWASISDFSFVSTFFSGIPQATLEKFSLNWLNFLKTMGLSLCAGFILWRVGVRLVHWSGIRAGNAALTFCLEMALGITGLNALWLGLGFNGLWAAPFPGTLAGALVL